MVKKIRLTPEQEFDMMKLIMDKLLWIGTIILLYGVFILFKGGWSEIVDSMSIIIVSAIVFIIFIVMLVRDYEWSKRAERK